MKRENAPVPKRNLVLRPALPVSAPFDQIIDWEHPLLRPFVARMPAAQALLDAWRSEPGYRWFFDRTDLDRLAAEVEPSVIREGVKLGRTFLSRTPQLPTTGQRMRKLRLDPKTRLSAAPGAVAIDWHEYDPKDNVEWMYMVNRQRYLPLMALAARRTRRADIAERVFELIDHWIANCPCPADIADKDLHWTTYGKTPWQELNTGLRVQSWLEALHILWDSPSLTAERFARIVWSLRQQFLVLGRVAVRRPRSAFGNHLIMEMQGLAYGSVLPWLKETEAVRAAAMHNLTHCVYRQVLPDGGHCQRTPSYHLGCTQWLAMPFLLARLNGWPVDPEVDRRLRAMLAFAVDIGMPDHRLANFGNSSESDDRASLAFLSRLLDVPLPWKLPLTGFNRLYSEAALGRPDRSRPSRRIEAGRSGPSWPLVRWYPRMGYLSARSSWDEQAHAVIMHVTGYGGGHCHSDWLSFIYSFGGRRIITERGVNTYDINDENTAFRKGRAHNILQIGERDAIFHQLTMWDKYVNAWSDLLAFEPHRDGSVEWTAQIRYLDNTTWRRRAAFDAPAGRLVLEDHFRSPREDNAELRFHLNTTHARMVSANECVTTDRGKPNIRIRVEGPRGLTAALTPVGISPSFWKRDRGLLLCFACRAHPPARWVTTIQGA